MENSGFWIGVLANAVFAGIVLFVALIIVRIRNHPLLEFWGLVDERRLRIYLSNLEIDRGDAAGPAGDADTDTSEPPENETNGSPLDYSPNISGMHNPGESTKTAHWSDSESDVARVLSEGLTGGANHSQPVSQNPHVNSLKGKNKIPRNYFGTAVAQPEFEIANKLKQKFYSIIDDNYDTVSITSGLLRLHADVEIKVAPDNADMIDQSGTVVSFGSPGYNEVSRKIEIITGNAVKFSDDNTAIRIPVLGVELRHDTQAIIVRYTAENRCWFYAAGLSTHGTIAAAHYLIDSWGKLESIRTETDSFFVVIEADPCDYKKSWVVAEGKLPPAVGRINHEFLVPPRPNL